MRKSYRESSVIRKFGQWVVTRYGVECSQAYYPIPAKRLFPDYDHYPIEKHLAGKNWVDMHSLHMALAFAREYFGPQHRRRAAR